MARRRRTDENPLPYFLAVIALLGLAFLGPLAAVVWWIICEGKAREVGAVMSVSELLASDEEVAVLAAAAASQEESLSRRALIQEEARANDVPHRSDGMYDGRSRLGREANEAINAAAEIGENALVQRLSIEAQIEERIEHWAGRTADLAGARAGLLGYLPLLSLAYLLCRNLLFAGALASLATGGVIWGVGQLRRAQLLASGSSDEIGDVAAGRPLLTDT